MPPYMESSAHVILSTRARAGASGYLFLIMAMKVFVCVLLVSLVAVTECQRGYPSTAQVRCVARILQTNTTAGALVGSECANVDFSDVSRRQCIITELIYEYLGYT